MEAAYLADLCRNWLDFPRRSRRCSRGRDEDASRFVYGRYRQPTSRSPYGNHQHTHQHSHQMHLEDEGIYETADPDRGSNTRGETPDCERYSKNPCITRNPTASLVAIIHWYIYVYIYIRFVAIHVYSPPLTPTPTPCRKSRDQIAHTSDKDGACVVVCKKEKKSSWYIGKPDVSKQLCIEKSCIEKINKNRRKFEKVGFYVQTGLQSFVVNQTKDSSVIAKKI